MFADTVLKGKVFTSNRAALRADAAAIKDGTFVYVGDAQGVEEFIGPDTEVLESGDGMFMPGFCDAHMHFSSGAGQFAYEIDIVGLETVDQYIDTIREYVEKNPGREFYKGMAGITPCSRTRAKRKLRSCSTPCARTPRCSSGPMTVTPTGSIASAWKRPVSVAAS